MLPQKLAFVDIETTGLDKRKGRIIEIGVLRIENNKIVNTFSSLVNPEVHISSFSASLTGISQKELEKSPTFSEIQKEIYNLLQDCIFVAHNVDFDYSFLRNEFKRNKRQLSLKRLCTVKLFRYLYPNAYSHNLDALIERFGFECERRHRAFDDAQVLWEFYLRLQRILPKKDLEKAITKILKMTSRKSFLRKSFGKVSVQQIK